MIRCKHVSEALRDNNWEDLPPMRKLGLRLHIMLCAVCGRFNKQIMQMQSGTRRFVENEEHLETGCCLPKESANAMRDSIREAMSQKTQD